MSQEWKIVESEECFVATDGDHTVDLDYDEDTAKRIFALRTHLDEWDADITESYGDNNFAVNAHKVKYGESPGEIKARVDLLRTALESIKDKVNSIGRNMVQDGAFWLDSVGAFVNAKDLTQAQLREIGYKTLTSWFNMDCPDLVKVGLHDLVNTLYFLTDNKSSHAKDYLASLVEAWEGKEVVDRRKWSDTDDGEYFVLTDEEADEIWDQVLENYIDECMELPPQLELYFDREKWKRDARIDGREKWKRDARIDGRGSSLARYDGCEYSVDVGDETFYIYRTN